MKKRKEFTPETQNTAFPQLQYVYFTHNSIYSLQGGVEIGKLISCLDRILVDHYKVETLTSTLGNATRRQTLDSYTKPQQKNVKVKSALPNLCL